jgi:hypothetical protein
MLRSGAPPPAPPPRPTPPPPPPPLQQPAPTPAASKAFAKANAAASSATHENTSGAGWVGLLKLVGQSPALVSCTPKLLRHQRVLRPHASALLPHMEKLGKHLPRMLDQMDALGPHLSNIIPMLPELMPHFDALLDVLPAIESELPMVIAHREALMPSLPYIVPQLTAMRPYIGQLVAKTAQLAPHTALLASHLHTIIPHLAVVVLHLDALAPHLDALLQEETLRSLLANADHVAARLRLLGPKLPALLPPGTPGGGDLLITSLLAGSDEDAAGVLSRAQTTAAPAAGAGKEGGAGFIGSLKRMFVKEVLGEEPSPKGAAHEPDIPRINAQAELVKERLNGIEVPPPLAAHAPPRPSAPPPA